MSKECGAESDDDDDDRDDDVTIIFLSNYEKQSRCMCIRPITFQCEPPVVHIASQVLSRSLGQPLRASGAKDVAHALAACLRQVCTTGLSVQGKGQRWP